MAINNIRNTKFNYWAECNRPSPSNEIESMVGYIPKAPGRPGQQMARIVS